MASVISKAADSIQPYAMRKNIEIVTSLEEPLSSIFGDEGTLAEVLINLGNNAIKYSYAGSQVIIKADEADDHVLISITDEGVGISGEDLPYIFDDFYRGKTSQAFERGYGLGLALSQRIVEIHNGSISVESEPGKGSTFVIRLPVYGGDLHSQPPLQAEVITSP